MSIERDVFLWLKRPTITNIKTVLEWAHKRAMRTDVYCSDTAKDVRKEYSDRPFEEALTYLKKEILGKLKRKFSFKET